MAIDRWFHGRHARLVACSAIYQIVWFGAVYSASRAQLLALGPGLLVAGLVVQCLLWPSLMKRMLVMLAVAVVAGVFIDGTLGLTGVLVPVRQLMPVPLPPVWLLTLWAGFGVYMATGLELMYGRPRMAVIAGGLAGPLAYRAGVPFGALELGGNPWISLAVVGVVWAVAFPVLLALAARLAKRGRPSCEMSVTRVALMLLLLGALFPASDAMALEGNESLFAPAKTLHDVEFVRRGVGRLRRWMIKGCDIALYTPPGSTRQTLFTGGPKALEFHYYVRISGEQFARASDETLKEELSSETYDRFKKQIDEMGRYFAAVEPGDRYLLYFVPGHGTALDLNGKRRGLIPGDAFADIYFRIWLGDKPLDVGLYKGMTGKMK